MQANPRRCLIRGQPGLDPGNSEWGPVLRRAIGSGAGGRSGLGSCYIETGIVVRQLLEFRAEARVRVIGVVQLS